MNVTLLSGVVRNRKQMASVVSRANELFATEGSSSNLSESEVNCSGGSGGGEYYVPLLRNHMPALLNCLNALPGASMCWRAVSSCGATDDTIDNSSSSSRGLRRSNFFLFRRFNLRVHKFVFQWDLVGHLLLCIFSLIPFGWTGERVYALVPVAVWLFYNVLFIISPHRSNLISRFGRFRTAFKATIEDFFSPKLLPLLSICFLCVVLSLAATGHRLGGPPLCYQSCSRCLASWQESIALPTNYGQHLSAVTSDTAPATESMNRVGHVADIAIDPYRIGCGYANGKELLAFYTMAQTSFLLFVVVVVAMTVCLAWRIAEEEKAERREAENWLKKDNPSAFALRQQVIDMFGTPASSSVRPEGNATWIFFGITAALTFTLLGWHNWYVLPPSPSATLLILLNLLTILMSTLILHVSFFGRLLSLYKRNYLRVTFFTDLLRTTTVQQLDGWWNCRNFVLNDDLAIDYDTGGLAVSAAFMINVFLFLVFIGQMYREANVQAMLEAPGSYCAYACLYITSCLIKLFTLATNTFEEQHRHIAGLQLLSNSLDASSQRTIKAKTPRVNSDGIGKGNKDCSNGTGAWNKHRDARLGNEWIVNDSDYEKLIDEGPIIIDDDEAIDGQQNTQHLPLSRLSRDGHQLVQEPASSIVAKSAEGNDLIDSENQKRQHSTESVADSQVVEGDKSNSGVAWDSDLLLNSIIGTSVMFPSQQDKKLENVSVDAVFQSESKESANLMSAANSPKGVIANTMSNDMAYLSKDGCADTSDNRNLTVTQPPAIVLPYFSRDNSFGDLEQGQPLSDTPFTSCVDENFHNDKVNASNTSGADSNAAAADEVPPRPALVRADSNSAYIEEQRNTIAEMIEQIRKYDPYPCILGIPVMPALFNTSKFYIFISFMLIGVRTMIACLRQI